MRESLCKTEEQGRYQNELRVHIRKKIASKTTALTFLKKRLLGQAK